MTYAPYWCARLPRASVSGPGMSIAHSRAKSTWSRSRTSSLKPWSAPSGIAISRTGQPRRGFDQVLEVLEICLDVVALPDAPHGGDETDGGVRANHAAFPPSVRSDHLLAFPST